jgi:PmbA protein
MIKQDLKDSMKKSIDYSMNNGVESCDVIISCGDSLSMKAQQGKIDKYDLSNSQVYGIRVIENDRVGIAFSESMDEDSLKLTSDMARENARNSDPNEFEKVNHAPTQTIIEENKDLLKRDDTTQAEKIELCLKLESLVKERDPRVETVPYNGVGESEYQHYYMNSPGSFCFQEERSVSCYSSALIREGEESSMNYYSSVARSFDSLDWNKCIDESILHASRWLKGTALKTGMYDVVFTPGSFGSLLGCFSNVFSAKAARDKVNPFMDKLEAQVAVSNFSITDCPTYSDSFIYTTFDDEGFLRSDLNLIENGVLKSFYHNTVTANYFNTKSTAHASRSAKSSLGVGGTTKVVSTGDKSEKDIYDGVIFEVHDMDGLHSGANSMSGDFSVACRGYLKKNGEIIQAVKGVTLAANYFKMLNQITAIGDSMKSNSSKTFFTPHIRFEGLSVAG